MLIYKKETEIFFLLTQNSIKIPLNSKVFVLMESLKNCHSKIMCTDDSLPSIHPSFFFLNRTGVYLVIHPFPQAAQDTEGKLNASPVSESVLNL